MKLFMHEVAPRLKQASAKLFADHFPEMERRAEMAL
jgi:hypothetical protein